MNIRISTFRINILLRKGQLLPINTALKPFVKRGSPKLPSCHKPLINCILTMNGKLVIITGATSGLGKATAFELARQGAKLILGCRNMEAANLVVDEIKTQCGNSNINAKYIDLTKHDTIHSFVKDIEQCHVLINNAGIMLEKRQLVNDMELTCYTNHIGPFLLTQLLLPKLINTSKNENVECRIVNVVSALEQRARAYPGKEGDKSLRGQLPDSTAFADRISDTSTYYGLLSGINWMKEGPIPYLASTAYANSMLCVLSTTYELDKQLRKDPSCKVTVNAICPGYVNTNLWKDFWMWSPIRFLFFKSPKKGCIPIVKAATSSDYDGISGTYKSSIVDTKPSVASLAPKLSHMIWNYSKSVTKMNDNWTH